MAHSGYYKLFDSKQLIASSVCHAPSCSLVVSQSQRTTGTVCFSAFILLVGRSEEHLVSKTPVLKGSLPE